MLHGEVGGIAGVGEVLFAPFQLSLLSLIRNIGAVGPRRALAAPPGTIARLAAVRRLAITCLLCRLVAASRLVSFS